MENEGIHCFRPSLSPGSLDSRNHYTWDKLSVRHNRTQRLIIVHPVAYFAITFPIPIFMNRLCMLKLAHFVAPPGPSLIIRD